MKVLGIFAPGLIFARIYRAFPAESQAPPDAQELAAYAQRIGAGATSVTLANFFKPGSVDMLVEYAGAVALQLLVLRPRTADQGEVHG